MPSRFDEPATGVATVVLIATDWPDDLERALAGLRAPRAGRDVGRDRRRRPVGRAGRPRSTAMPAARRHRRSSGRPRGWATRAATNIGIRRASGAGRRPARHEPRADRRHRDAARGRAWTTRRSPWPAAGASCRATCGRSRTRRPGDVDAIEGYARPSGASDAAERGPLDERFRFYRNLDIWWSLVLRDEGEGETAPPRRAASAACPSSATSIAAGRACPTTSATASASGTSTGSSTGSGGAATC